MIQKSGNSNNQRECRSFKVARILVKQVKSFKNAENPI